MRYEILYETSAAYVGYGDRLCDDYVDKEGCKKEQDNMDSEVVMIILFTRTVLTVTLNVMKSAFYLYEPDFRHYLNFDLGYDFKACQQNE